MRPVEIFEWVFDTKAGRCSDKSAGTGLFHQWGLEIQENEYGIGTYSVALVERENGRIECVEARLIRFTDGGGV